MRTLQAKQKWVDRLREIASFIEDWEFVGGLELDEKGRTVCSTKFIQKGEMIIRAEPFYPENRKTNPMILVIGDDPVTRHPFEHKYLGRCKPKLLKNSPKRPSHSLAQRITSRYLKPFEIWFAKVKTWLDQHDKAGDILDEIRSQLSRKFKENDAVEVQKSAKVQLFRNDVWDKVFGYEVFERDFEGYADLTMTNLTYKELLFFADYWIKNIQNRPREFSPDLDFETYFPDHGKTW